MLQKPMKVPARLIVGLCYLSSGMHATAATQPSPGRSHLRATQVVRRVVVPLELALSFTNRALARDLASGDNANGNVQHFCKCVSAQASGSQAYFAAQPLGVTVATHVIPTATNGIFDYECSIVATVREAADTALTNALLDDQLVGPFFVLQVALEQAVYISGNAATSLSRSAIQEVVEAGFAFGTGGRVKFRELLNDEDDFAAVVTVDVLDALSSSLPPQQQPVPSAPPPTTPPPVVAAPVASPAPVMATPVAVPMTPAPTAVATTGVTTLATTFVPVVAATPVPTVKLSAKPTPFDPSSVSSLIPTLELTLAPTPQSETFAPSRRPMFLAPAQLPTEAPSKPRRPTAPPMQVAGNASPEDTDSNRPWVWGSVAAGSTTIFFACLFLSCLIFRHYAKEQESSSSSSATGGHQANRVPHDGSVLSYSSSSSRRSGFVPGTVAFDDELKSLADTTLGDQTAGGAFRQTLPPANKKRLIDLEPLNNSYDDDSLYTSPATHEVSDSYLQPSRPPLRPSPPAPGTRSRRPSALLLPTKLDRTLAYEDELVFPHSSSMDSSKEGPKNASSNAASSARVSLPVDLDDVSTEDISFGDASKDGKTNTASDASLPILAEARSNEQKAQEVNRSLERGTKGFDPFGTGSDVGISESLVSYLAGDDDESQLPPPPPPIHKNSLGSSAEKTRQIEQLLKGCLPFTTGENSSMDSASLGDLDDSAGDSFGEQPEGAFGANASHARSSSANDSLLRTVLENSRLLALAESASNRSRASLNTVPARFQTRDDRLRANNTQRTLEESKSFDDASPNRMRSRKPSFDRRALTDWPREELTNQLSEDSSAASDDNFSTKGIAHLGTFNMSDSPDEPADMERDLCPSSHGSEKLGEQSSSEGSSAGALGAEPRAESIITLPYVHDFQFPDTSRRGILGISTHHDDVDPVPTEEDSNGPDSTANPWLFDTVEDTLGPMSRSADLESLGGRSFKSNRSAKSSSGKSDDGNKIFHGVSPPGPDASSPIALHARGTKMKAPTAMDLGIKPRALENDLRRLEMQLSEILDRQPRYELGGSIKSGNDSRSTLSARLQKAKRRKRKRVVLVVPPGKLGLVLANNHDGKGTVVSDVRKTSSMVDLLQPGDKIVAVDGEDVSQMQVAEITELMSSKVDRERRLTVVTSSRMRGAPGETKIETI